MISKQEVVKCQIFKVIRNAFLRTGNQKLRTKRKKQHINNLKNHIHPNYKIQKDFDDYGEENFIFEIIDELEGTEEEGYEYEVVDF